MALNSYPLITDLPSEAWRLFSRFLGHLELSRLCQSSPRLNVLICHPNGCDFLHVVYGLSCHFPRLAFSLSGLRSLDLNATPYFAGQDRSLHEFRADVLDRLPKSLTCLRVRASNALYAFFQNYRGQCDQLSSSSIGMSQNSVVDIHQILPNLLELDLDDSICAKFELMPLVLPHLPDTLTSLRLLGSTNNIIHAQVTSLPTHLVTFECKCYQMILERSSFLLALSRLPSLERLALEHIGFTKDDDPLRYLSPSLTDLSMCFHWDRSAFDLASSRFPHLKRLYLGHKSFLSADCLFPHTIVDLSIPQRDNIPVGFVGNLPRGIEKLLIGQMTDWDLTGLPPNLRTLALECFQYSHEQMIVGEAKLLETLKSLPPSLERLNFRGISSQHFCLNRIHKLLPATLAACDRYYKFSPTSENDLAPILPPSLTIVSGNISYPPAEPLKNGFVHGAPLIYFKSLPQRLQTLVIHSVTNLRDPGREPTDEKEKMSWTILGNLIPVLPPTLTELSLPDTRFVSDACLLGLPRGLLKLIITYFDTNNLAPMSFTSSGLKSLPPHLTTLSLVLNEHVDAGFFPYLPSGLRDLQLDRLEKVQDSDIPLLPRTIVKLQLLAAKGPLTDNCIPLLPPMIESLTLPKVSTFTPAMIALLPPLLQSLRIGFLAS